MKIFYKVEIWVDGDKYVVPIDGDDYAAALMSHFMNDDDEFEYTTRTGIPNSYFDSFKIFAKVHGHDVEVFP